MLGSLAVTGAALLALAGVATVGYRALTREDVAAVVTTEPVSAQQFRAIVELPDGTRATYLLAGDALYVDAHIVKWHPVANLFGVHTGYQLDRIAGRYADIDDERTQPRTVYALTPARRFDIYRITRTYRSLAPIVDAEYGSATFVSGREPATFEVRVSTSGLLARRLADPARASN
ncbi:MAG: hypothetical protein FJ027_13210 [Candidatus Rokubacteria bacterium]|nr:hypothetical protein [Candidatus Rokubacteria bacterium]